jgi:hypothetical protein
MSLVVVVGKGFCLDYAVCIFWHDLVSRGSRLLCCANFRSWLVYEHCKQGSVVRISIIPSLLFLSFTAERKQKLGLFGL